MSVKHDSQSAWPIQNGSSTAATTTPMRKMTNNKPASANTVPTSVRVSLHRRAAPHTDMRVGSFWLWYHRRYLFCCFCRNPVFLRVSFLGFFAALASPPAGASLPSAAAAAPGPSFESSSPFASAAPPTLPDVIGRIGIDGIAASAASSSSASLVRFSGGSATWFFELIPSMPPPEAASPPPAPAVTRPASSASRSASLTGSRSSSSSPSSSAITASSSSRSASRRAFSSSLTRRLGSWKISKSLRTHCE
mmetsp:Transcript_6230/g.22130  ORF Transcript_6230/g.22130 Transcript_6230/m.22130 type:complete len:250 (+) Transcript_6230:1223-1972(+)